MADRHARMGLLTMAFGVGFLVWLVLGSVPRTSAIPAFARKYQTSCSTCHNDYPELNDFGEAFKKNGFKFPKDDETFVKEAPILLGAKAYKNVFPKAVYPGEIPGSLPLGFRYSGFAMYNSKQPLSIGFLPRTDLFTPNTFTIIAAGSLGPTLSFWVDNDISSGGANGSAFLGDGYLKVNDLGHYIGLPKDTLNLRMGQFELDLPFTQARSIDLTSYDIYSQASTALSQGTTSNPFVFGIPQRGIEIGGYPNDGNFAWSVSVVDGSNNGPALRNSKDVYVRVSQRFNLERDASVRKEVQAAGPTGPRDHTSLRFGAFYYHGRNALFPSQMITLPSGVFPIADIHEPFYRAGGDFRFKYRQFELYGLGMYGHDDNHLPIPSPVPVGFIPVAGPPVTFSGGFAQAQYWFYPWVTGLMRYDVVNSPTDFLNGVSRHNSRNRFSPGVQLLVRANIKVAFEYQHRWEQPVPSTVQFFRPNGFATGFDYVF
jgi:hypothetical protein